MIIIFKTNSASQTSKYLAGPEQDHDKRFLIKEEVNLLEELEKTNPLLQENSQRKLNLVRELFVLFRSDLKKIDDPHTRLEDID